VKVGDKVSVKTVAYPDKAFFGTIKKIGTMLDRSRGLFASVRNSDNSDGLLKPEMFATVIITSQTSEKVLAVSEKALVLENNNFYVMKETSPNTFEKVKVTVGRKFSDFTEVNRGFFFECRRSRYCGGSLFALTASNQKS